MDSRKIRSREIRNIRYASNLAAVAQSNAREEKRKKNPSEDTKIRIEIQKTIRNMCFEQKLSKDEVLEQLNEKYGDFKYLKYRQYFEAWVNNVLGIKENKVKNESNFNNI